MGGGFKSTATTSSEGYTPADASKKTVYASSSSHPSSPRPRPSTTTAKAKTKAAPPLDLSNEWGWVCTTNRMPTRHCETCLGFRLATSTMLRATHWVCSQCGEPNKVTRFTCLVCQGARTQPSTSYRSSSNGRALYYASYHWRWGLSVWALHLQRDLPGGHRAWVPATTPTTGEEERPACKAPLARTAHFLFTENRHLFLASGGYVTRRTREIILRNGFLDFGGDSDFGVVPEQEFQLRLDRGSWRVSRRCRLLCSFLRLRAFRRRAPMTSPLLEWFR